MDPREDQATAMVADNCCDDDTDERGISWNDENTT
jgi:hypothetical protein